MTTRPVDRPQQRRYEPLAILSYIARYKAQHGGQSPSQRRIQRDLGISSPSGAHAILHRLARAGLLTITTYGRGLPADVTLTEAGQLAAQRWREARAEHADATRGQA